jgi:hypothetical protein
MERIQCFLIEPTPRTERKLRRYRGGSEGEPKCPGKWGYHNGHTAFGEGTFHYETDGAGLALAHEMSAASTKYDPAFLDTRVLALRAALMPKDARERVAAILFEQHLVLYGGLSTEEGAGAGRRLAGGVDSAGGAATALAAAAGAAFGLAPAFGLAAAAGNLAAAGDLAAADLEAGGGGADSTLGGGLRGSSSPVHGASSFSFPFSTIQSARSSASSSSSVSSKSYLTRTKVDFLLPAAIMVPV